MTNENKELFKEACVDTNSIDELIEGLESRCADKPDMRTWGITATEWRDALAGALRTKIEDLQAEIPPSQ